MEKFNLTRALKDLFWFSCYVRNKSTWNYSNARQCYERYIRNRNSDSLEEKKIAFLVPSVQLFYHFLPIAKYLDKDLFTFIPICKDSQKANSIIKLFDSFKVPYLTIRKLIKRNQKFKVVVSNIANLGHEFYPPFSETSNLLSALGTVQVRMMYAGGKLKWNLSEWNEIYHYIFCYGPFYKQKFEEKFIHAKVFEMGYPRLDEYFLENLNKVHELEKLGLDSHKETIAYLPTHGDLSTYNKFSLLIDDLAEFYNIIIKPHEWLEVDKKGNGKSIYIADKDENNVKYFRIADYIFTDYGGSVLGAIYVDKKTVLLDVNDPLASTQNMNSESPDLTMRQHLRSIKKFSIQEIMNLLKDKEYWLSQEQTRRHLRETFFKFSPKSGELAATELLNILEKQ